MSERPSWMPDGERLCMAFDLAAHAGMPHITAADLEEDR